MNVHALSVFGFLAAVASTCSATALGQVSNLRHPVRSETLIWADEFDGPAQTQPDPANWSYDVGSSGWGNKELETYCGWGSKTAPCDPAQLSAFVGGDGLLHIRARSLGAGVYSSARLKSQDLQSFKYGRVEARIKIPEGQGIWPAFWMLGDNIDKVGWPSCGELDIMENIGKEPSIVHGSVHAPGVDLTGTSTLPDDRKLAADFHIYGMIWSPGRIQFYLDTPSNPYATFTSSGLAKNAIWPFDSGKFFILLNLAVGGYWPGSPDATTRFPQEMLVDYVRVYSLQALR